MSRTIQEIILEAQQLSQAQSLKAAGYGASKDVFRTPIGKETSQSLLNDLLYFYERFTEFGSTVLHNHIHSEVMFMLSAYFVQMVKLEMKEVQIQRSLPSPAMEAICNLLLILAETDPAAYSVALALLPDYVWPDGEIAESMANELSMSQEALGQLHKYRNLMQMAPTLVNRCATYLPQYSEYDCMRILNHVYVLLETTGSWYRELQENKEKWSLSEIVLN